MIQTIIGQVIFGLIITASLFSTHYFIFYQSYQEDLINAKTNKLNELNSLFKGALVLGTEVQSLSFEIKLLDSPEKINTIDILRHVTTTCRNYQNTEINNTRDDFNRVMITYDSIESENRISNNNKK